MNTPTNHKPSHNPHLPPSNPRPNPPTKPNRNPKNTQTNTRKKSNESEEMPVVSLVTDEFGVEGVVRMEWRCSHGHHEGPGGGGMYATSR